MEAVRLTLEDLGFSLRDEWWYEWWVRSRQRSPEHAVAQCLLQDFSQIGLGHGTIPMPQQQQGTVATPSCIRISGPHVFQVIEMEDVSRSVLQRSRERAGMAGGGNSSTRLMKLTLTDGARILSAMEARPCPLLREDIVPPGCKIRLSSYELIASTTILLQPENIPVLGGSVISLMAENERKWSERMAAVACRAPKEVRSGGVAAGAQVSPNAAANVSLPAAHSNTRGVVMPPPPLIQPRQNGAPPPPVAREPLIRTPSSSARAH